MVRRNIKTIVILTVLFWFFIGFSPINPMAKRDSFKDFERIGLASMQYFSERQYRPLQKIALWTFRRQRSLMREIINTLRIHKQLRSEATILRIGEGEVLSPFPGNEQCLQTFHLNADKDSYKYLNEIASYNKVRLIVFSSIDKYIVEEFEEREGDIEISINIYYPQMYAFQQEPILITSQMMTSISTAALRELIRDACAKALKDAIDDKTTLF